MSALASRKNAGLSWLTQLILLAAGSFALSLGALYLSRQPGSVATVWYANAYALGFLLNSRHRASILGTTWICGFIANLIYGDPVALSAVLALANLLEIVVAFICIERSGLQERMLEGPTSFLRFLWFGSVMPPLAGATFGAFVLQSIGVGQFIDIWPAWYIGSVIGSIAILPLAVSWKQHALKTHVSTLLTPETISFALMALGVAAFTLTSAPFPFIYIMAPLVAAAVRLPFTGVAAITFLVAVTVSALMSLGYFAAPPYTNRWQELFFFTPLLATMLPPLLLAVSIEYARRNAKRLSDSEERFRAAFASAPIGMALVDLNGRFFQVNPALCHIVGYTEDELVQLTFQAITHPDDLEIDVALVRALQEKRRTDYQLEKRYLHKDGHAIWILLSASTVEDSAGNIVYFIAQIQDITIRRDMEQSLREREHFLHTITDALPSLVGYWGPDLRCRFANNAYFSWFGKTKEQMLGIHVRQVLGDDMFKISEPFLHATLNGRPQRFERVFRKKAGGETYAWTHYIPDVAPDGTVKGLFSLVFDVTELKQAQMASELANQALTVRTHQAEAASRAKSDFVANMSHEIRTPMNAVLGLLHLLESTQLDARQRDYLVKIHNAARALLSILNDVLDYSKIESGKLELENVEFRLDEILETVTGLFAITAEQKGIELFVDVGANVPASLKGDPLRLSQVLNNLVGNAVKFTPKGEIHLSVKVAQQSATHIRLEFTVRDTGIGMTPDQQRLLFQEFSQADTTTTRKYGGTGLGLAISKRLVELMGGNIGLDSVVDQGSTFRFSVQLDQTEHNPTPNVQGLHGLRTLVVDDHATSCEILSRLLRSWGMQVETATSGEQAWLCVERAAAQAVAFELMLFDWHMPEMDGLALAERAKRGMQTGHLPPTSIVLMMTEAERAELTGDTQTPPPYPLLQKPVTPSRLFDTLADVCHLVRPVVHAPRSTRQDWLGRAASLRGARVLLAEDHPINQQVACELLERMGLTVDVAGNGKIALQMAAEHPYDLVLLDLQMPEMDGFETAARLRASEWGRDIPIVAMTAAAMSDDRMATIRAGMNGHVSKPIDIDELLSELLRWIAPRAESTSQPILDDDMATTESPASTPDLPGFDLAQALHRTGGDVDLLKRLLRRFVGDYRDIAQILDNHIEANHPDEAVKLLHGFKGVAGNLGAMAAHHAANQLEDEVKAGAPLLTLASFKQTLERTLDYLDDFLSAELHTTLPFDLKEVKTDLNTIAHLIQRNRPVPAELIQQLRDRCAAHASMETVRTLTIQLEDFDYGRAQETVRQLMSALEAS